MDKKYYLNWHHPVSTKNYFSQMSEYVSEEEKNDQYGAGKALKNFENELAELFGKEAGLFLQSGTMAQQIALRIWTDQKNNKNIAFHPKCHLEIHEHKSYDVLHNLKAELVGDPDQLMGLEDLKSLQSNPSAVLIELPQREIGGQLPEWDDLVAQVDYLKSKSIIVHLDGARVWECTTYYSKSLKEIASLFDSVYISFYKGVGAIAGAALLGSSDFIKEAHIWNRRHGGNLITSSPFYVSARYNLKKRINSFESYYKKTIEIYNHISKIDGIKFRPDPPQVNMFHLYINRSSDSLQEVSKKVAEELNIQHIPNIYQSKKYGSRLEWYVGDATLDVPNLIIEEFFKKIVNLSR